MNGPRKPNKDPKPNILGHRKIIGSSKPIRKIFANKTNKLKKPKSPFLNLSKRNLIKRAQLKPKPKYNRS